MSCWSRYKAQKRKKEMRLAPEYIFYNVCARTSMYMYMYMQMYMTSFLFLNIRVSTVLIRSSTVLC
jgi:hypothetical protein